MCFSTKKLRHSKFCSEKDFRKFHVNLAIIEIDKPQKKKKPSKNALTMTNNVPYMVGEKNQDSVKKCFIVSTENKFQETENKDFSPKEKNKCLYLL